MNSNRFNGMRADRRKALELADLEMERDRQQLEQATAAQVRAILEQWRRTDMTKNLDEYLEMCISCWNEQHEDCSPNIVRGGTKLVRCLCSLREHRTTSESPKPLARCWRCGEHKLRPTDHPRFTGHCPSCDEIMAAKVDKPRK